MKDNKAPWILAAYALFAKGGPDALKVEVIARQVGKNKSSFYHYFANLDIFTDHLLDYHLERTKIIADKERQCKNVDPELIEVIIEVKQDLLFNRQLRIHRDNPKYCTCLQQAGHEVRGAILGIWADALNLNHQTYLAELVLNLSLENFYLQITEETLNYNWLSNYIRDLQTMVRAFQQNKPAGT